MPKSPQQTANSMAINGLEALRLSPGANRVIIVPVGLPREVERDSPKSSVETDNPKSTARKEVNR